MRYKFLWVIFICFYYESENEGITVIWITQTIHCREIEGQRSSQKVSVSPLKLYIMNMQWTKCAMSSKCSIFIQLLLIYTKLCNCSTSATCSEMESIFNVVFILVLLPFFYTQSLQSAKSFSVIPQCTVRQS